MKSFILFALSAACIVLFATAFSFTSFFGPVTTTSVGTSKSPFHQTSLALRRANKKRDMQMLFGSDQKSASVPLGTGDISAIKEGIKPPENLNGSDVRVGIIMSRWNADIITGLYQGVNESLTKCGVKPSNVFTTFVPGAYEMPVTAKLLAASKRVDVIINLGCLIKGDTMHFEYIAEAVTQGLMRVSLDTTVPCLFGVLTVLKKDQAIKRSTGDTNEGLSWGTSAVEMGLTRMAAMGMGVTGKGVSSTEAAPFVTFQGNLTGDGKNATAKPKKIAF
mmetsp:Transcript_31780/g.53608  ORF Transcript_31780/g.53608 Transcript_31780/m.53608 type:complete len:277 (-) Transcript_31780:427-1257(-)|eukprot:CAMPEP_0174967856 /NCGR_PEP_ID=MMETSP0004_2-20121128/7811_1 /TAXON_ID=420556 /ORGANISM="Ochromonas sp., Strain CCMP1393" /LENGTH=276 /DNA_ID=CAMNT_0016217025 /DNA_START=79 /DNA_END=909 /DNA_ORIENTATION=+